MSSNYLFNEVTGQSDYERQSWRDSYNGGRAAGDLTGNVNRELDAQREANNGRTESGSSTQYAALEVAPVRQGNATAAVGAGAPKSAGPGNETVKQGPGAPGRPAGGSGAGSKLIFSGPPPLTSKIKDTATGGYAGFEVKPNPWFSDVQEWWEPRYGEPGEWLGGIVNIGADAVFHTWKVGHDVLGPQVGRGAFEAERAVGGWFNDAAARINAPISPQEPVDWGR